MAVSLYNVSVQSFLQGLAGVAAILDTAQSYCRENDIDTTDLVESRVHASMLPLRFQILSVAHHSLQAIKDVKRALYLPPPHASSHSYADLVDLIAHARDDLGHLTPPEINALEGKDMLLDGGEVQLPMKAEAFLVSISLPNFYFHVTTMYNILRARGVPVGKLDYIGPMRTHLGV